jgi:hypothetical protein
MADNHYVIPADANSRVKYGGYEFSELIKTSVEIVPVMNTAKTGIKYLKQTFTIEAIVGPRDTTMNSYNSPDEFPYQTLDFNDRMANGTIYCSIDSTDETLDAIKSTLMTPQLDFFFNGRGYGSYESYYARENETGDKHEKTRDVLFGPMPKVLTWEPIAHNKLARVVWKVEIHRRPACTSLKSPSTGLYLVELWSSSRVNINASGYHTVTREGQIEIAAQNSPLFKSKTGKLLEKYRQLIYDYLLTDWRGQGFGQTYAGYHISNQDYKFSPDLLTCDYSITWKEVESPNPYPPGVKEIDVRHRVRSELNGGKYQKNFRMWKNDFSARIVLFPKEPAIRAWATFTRLINERIEQGTELRIDGNDRIIRVPLILSINLEESLFSHEYKYDVSWTIATDALTLFQKSGMFKPALGSNVADEQGWQEWTASARLVQNSYGAFPIVEHKDITINLAWCAEGMQPYDMKSGGYSSRGFSPEFLQSVYNFQCPPEQASYLEFQNNFQFDTSTDLSMWQRYRTDTVREEEKSDVNKERKIKISTKLDSGQKKEDYIIQDMGRDAFSVTMRGYAIRMGGPTNPPVITKVGGKEVTPNNDPAKNDFVKSSMISQYGNCPIYLTTWQKNYTILGKPEGDIEEDKETSGKPSDY